MFRGTPTFFNAVEFKFALTMVVTCLETTGDRYQQGCAIAKNNQ